MAQFRGRMAREYPGFHTRIAAAIVRLAMAAPQATAGSPPFRFPTVFHQFMWQLIYADPGKPGQILRRPGVVRA